VLKERGKNEPLAESGVLRGVSVFNVPSHTVEGIQWHGFFL